MEIYQGKQVAGFPLGKEEIKRSGGGKNLCYQYELMITHLSLPVTNVQIYVSCIMYMLYMCIFHVTSMLCVFEFAYTCW